LQYELNKQINRTKDGLLLLTIGTILSPIPILNSVGAVISLLGALFVILGREAFGSAHSRNAAWSVLIYILGLIIFFFLSVALLSSLETNLQTNSDPASLRAALIATFDSYFIAGVIGGALIWIAAVLFTYALQDHRGRILLWSALVTSQIIGIGIVLFVGPILADAVSQAVATSSLAPLNTFQATLTTLRLVGLVPTGLYAVALYGVWARIDSGEIPRPIVSSVGLGPPSQGGLRPSPGETLLKVEGLRTYFYTYAGVVKAVDGVSLEVKSGETLGIVGESGSGKTVTALSIMRIVPPPGKIVEGKILFKKQNLLLEPDWAMQDLRGKEISYIFQDPTTTLDPVYTVGEQLAEVIMRHQGADRIEAMGKAIELLRLVEIPDPEVRVNQYPHQLSGGTKQRIAIARALSCNPSLLIADEPTTALDVTIQAQILELMNGLKIKFDMSMILITHDMGIVAETCDRVTILYAGQVCETGTAEQVFQNPKHPYTEALLTSVPHLALRRDKLSVIPGNVPNLIEPPSGCRFHPRCKYAQQICIDQDPKLELIEDERWVHCHRARELELKSPVAS
jgi:peptide/nickel transport system ATP-binding protein